MITEEVAFVRPLKVFGRSAFRTVSLPASSMHVEHSMHSETMHSGAMHSMHSESMHSESHSAMGAGGRQGIFRRLFSRLRQFRAARLSRRAARLRG